MCAGSVRLDAGIRGTRHVGILVTVDVGMLAGAVHTGVDGAPVSVIAIGDRQTLYATVVRFVAQQGRGAGGGAALADPADAVIVCCTKEAVLACKRVVDVLARTTAVWWTRAGARIVGAHIVVIAVVVAVASHGDSDGRAERLRDVARENVGHHDRALNRRLAAHAETWKERDLTGPAANGLELDRGHLQSRGGRTGRGRQVRTLSIGTVGERRAW